MWYNNNNTTQTVQVTMNKELQEFFEGQFDMFGTPGWKELMLKAEEILETYNNVRVPKTIEDLARTQGYIEMLDWLIGWEQLVTDTYKQYESSDEQFPTTV